MPPADAISSVVSPTTLSVALAGDGNPIASEKDEAREPAVFSFDPVSALIVPPIGSDNMPTVLPTAFKPCRAVSPI